MTEPITMHDEYAHRHDPTTKVRILCVDRPGFDEGNTVVSMCEKGVIRGHSQIGKASLGLSDFDIVPLQRKPREWWVNDFGGAQKYVHTTKAEADFRAGSGINVDTIHVREVLD